MLANSFSSQNFLAPEDVRDGVTIQYTDASTWEPAEVTRTASGATNPSNPLKVNLRGITNQAQAVREALYRARLNQYRRMEVTFACEAEGLLLSIGDKILVQHDTMKWGTAGDVLAIESRTQLPGTADQYRLILTEPVEFNINSSVQHFIWLRKKDGGMQRFNVHQPTASQLNTAYDPEFQVLLSDPTGVARVTVPGGNVAGAPERVFHPNVAGQDDFTFYGFDGASELTHFIFGYNSLINGVLIRNAPQELVVRDVKPRGENLAQITADIENTAIYAD